MRANTWSVKRELAPVREVAVLRAADPLTLQDLRCKISEVGALTFGGRRVELALYHQGSVLGPGGALKLPRGAGCHLSPVSGEPVDGFLLAPPLSELATFVAFADWDDDGWLTVVEVATALAAVLPVDAEGAERFLRDRFDVGHDEAARVSAKTLCDSIIPACFREGRAGEAAILRAAPALEPPQLLRTSDVEELGRWFDHWDVHRGGDLEVEQLRFAVALTLFKALSGVAEEVSAQDQKTAAPVAAAAVSGSSAVGTPLDSHGNGRSTRGMELAMKEMVAASFLSSFRLEDYVSRRSRISREDFCEHLAPALLANMADPPADPDGADLRQLSKATASSDRTGSVDAAIVHAATVMDSGWLPSMSPAVASMCPSASPILAQQMPTVPECPQQHDPHPPAPGAAKAAQPLSGPRRPSASWHATSASTKEPQNALPRGTLGYSSKSDRRIQKSMAYGVAEIEAAWLPPQTPDTPCGPPKTASAAPMTAQPHVQPRRLSASSVQAPPPSAGVAACRAAAARLVAEQHPKAGAKGVPFEPSLTSCLVPAAGPATPTTAPEAAPLGVLSRLRWDASEAPDTPNSAPSNPDASIAWTSYG